MRSFEDRYRRSMRHRVARMLVQSHYRRKARRSNSGGWFWPLCIATVIILIIIHN